MSVTLIAHTIFKKNNSIIMKLAHFMLTASAIIFAWLTVSYLRPVPGNTYEHSSDRFTAQDTNTITEVATASVE